MRSFLQRSFFYGYLTLLLSFESFFAESSTAATAQVIHKILHKNGLKEFTVQKNIKGTECACSCFCALPDSPEALNQLEGKNPEHVAHQSFSPEMSRRFKIEKEIRGNHCKCACACAVEPELELVGSLQHDDGAAQQQMTTTTQDIIISESEFSRVADATQSSINTQPASNEILSIDSTKNHRVEEEQVVPIGISSTETPVITRQQTTTSTSKESSTAQETTITISQNTEQSSTETITTNKLVTGLPAQEQTNSMLQSTTMTIIPSTSESTTSIGEIMSSSQITTESSLEETAGMGPSVETSTLSTTGKTEVVKKIEIPSNSSIIESTEKPENEETSTFDPVFKARVAKLLSQLKEQLFKLRQMEQQQASEAVSNETFKTEQNEETNQLFFQIDQDGTQGVKNNAGNSLEVDNTSTESTIKFSTSGLTTHPKSSTNDSISQTSTHAKNESDQMLVSESTPTLVTGPAFLIGNDESDEAEDDEKMHLLVPNSTNNVEATSTMSVSSTEIIANFTANENMTESIQETTLNPMFKAKVANLLNRLKEQLYRLRSVQQEKKQIAANQTDSVNATEATAKNTSDILISANSSLITGNGTSKTEQMLEGWQQKLQQLQAKTETISNRMLPSNNLTVSTNGSIDTSNGARKELLGETSSPVNISLTISSDDAAKNGSYEELGFAFVTEAVELGNVEVDSNVLNSTTTSPNVFVLNASVEAENGNQKIVEKMATTISQIHGMETSTNERLFPLPTDFLVDVPSKDLLNKEIEAQEADEQRNRVILLPAPPNARALFMATVGPPLTTTESVFDGSDENVFDGSTKEDAPVVSHCSTSAIPENNEKGEIQMEFGATLKEQTTNAPQMTLFNNALTAATASTKPQSNNGRKKLITPQAQNLIERLEQARRLREEQVKLEMMEAIRQEQLGGSAEPDLHLVQRRREIEQQLLQLAQAERIHREMLERQRRVEEAKEIHPSTDHSPASTPISCDPVRRFIQLFRISQPRQWIEQNCQFARRHFPQASCTQIGTLLSQCLHQQQQQTISNKSTKEKQNNQDDSN